MITPPTPTRITGYEGDHPRWRLTLQREAREGRSLTYIPEVVTSHGAGPDFVISHLFRGFRPSLEIVWDYGMSSDLEIWDDVSGWVASGQIPTAQALLELLRQSDLNDLTVEPYTGSSEAIFSARCYAEPCELRDVKGVLHSGLKLTLTATGGMPTDGGSTALPCDSTLPASIPAMVQDGRPLHLIVPGMAAAWDSTVVYRLAAGAIWAWSPATGQQTLWASIPNGTPVAMACSQRYLHLYYLRTPPVVDPYSATNEANWPGWEQGQSMQVYRRKLDGSAGWEDRGLYGVTGFLSWDQSWNNCYLFAAMPFPSGVSLVNYKYRNTASSVPPVQEMQLDTSPTWWASGSAARGMYYASADRAYIGSWQTTQTDDTTETSAIAYTEAGNGAPMHANNAHPSWYLNSIGLNWWAFEPGAAHAVGSSVAGEASASGVLAAPPIPFGGRSLLVLSSGGRALWFDGHQFTPCELGLQTSPFRTVHYGPPYPWTPAGSYQSLADGGLLQVVA